MQFIYLYLRRDSEALNTGIPCCFKYSKIFFCLNPVAAAESHRYLHHICHSRPYTSVSVAHLKWPPDPCVYRYKPDLLLQPRKCWGFPSRSATWSARYPLSVKNQKIIMKFYNIYFSLHIYSLGGRYQMRLALPNGPRVCMCVNAFHRLGLSFLKHPLVCFLFVILSFLSFL